MHLKVSNLIAIQLGVLIGIMSWLAYSRLQSNEPRSPAVEKRESPAAPLAAAAPISDMGNQVSRALDGDINREQDQSTDEQPVSATLPHQYSPEAVKQYMEMATQQYYQQIAPRRYASAAVATSTVATAPAYTEVTRQPAPVSSDYVEPVQTVAYSEPAQVIVYPQPQFVVFSDQRRFPNRCRPALQSAAGNPIAHRRPDRVRPHQNVCPPPRQNHAPSCRPGQESRPRGKR
jgi:hypothetical protein